MLKKQKKIYDLHKNQIAKLEQKNKHILTRIRKLALKMKPMKPMLK